MLKKLLKYDLLYTYKLIILYYMLSLIFAVFTRFFLNFDTTLLNIIGIICSGVTITLMINIIINTLIRNWARFNINFYKDESYLTHTLPVSKNKLYLSKFITAFITMFTSVLVIILSLFVAFYSKENFNLLKDMLFGLSNMYNASTTLFVISTIIVFFLEMLLMLIIVYTGIILGNKKNNNKNLWSVIYSIILYFLTQGILLVGIVILGLINKDIMNLFTTNTLANLSVLKTIMIFSIIIYSLFVIIYTFINLKLFNKGVNVD